MKEIFLLLATCLLTFWFSSSIFSQSGIYENDNAAVLNNGTSSGKIYYDIPDVLNGSTSGDRLSIQKGTDYTSIAGAGNNIYPNTGSTLDYYDFNNIDLETVDFGCSKNPFSILSMSGNAKIYVDSSNTSGSQTGTSWVKAFSDLQDAIDIATSGDTICVAEGSYFPSEYPRGCVDCDRDNNFTFHLKDSVVIIGGYPTGGGTRNTTLHITTFDGNIGSNNSTSDNVYHVCLITDGTRRVEVHGVTIANGHGVTSIGDIQVGSVSVEGDLGAGLYVQNAQVELSNISFINNEAIGGGGLSVRSDSANVICRSCSFLKNEARRGAGVQVSNGSLSLNKAIFRGNEWRSISTPGLYATSLYAAGSANIFINNTLIDDSVIVNPVMFAWCPQFEMINSTVTQAGPDSVPAILFHTNTNYQIFNCILPIDSNALDNINGAGIVINNSIVHASWPGTGNIHEIPIFMDPAGGDYRLRYDSPARNKGDNGYAIQGDSTDLEGNPRIFEDTVDMGAYEYVLPGPSATRIYVDAAATGNDDGSTWVDAYNELFEGLGAADSLDTVFVALATYFPKPNNFEPRLATFNINEAMTILGGYPSGGARDEERDGNVFRPVLSGDIGVVKDLSDNLYVVLTIDGGGQYAIQMDGLAIKFGNANSINFSEGGAILLNQDVTLNNVWIERNNSNKFGPVQFLSGNARLILNDCILRLNTDVPFQSRSGGQVDINQGTSID